MKIITLTRGMVTQVDDADYESLSVHKWYAQRCSAKKQKIFYAARRDVVTGKIVLMHRQLLGLTERSQRGDHQDLDSLNNQRSNLRLATHSQNLCNTRKRDQKTTSRYKGVSYFKQTNRWEAYVWVDGKKIRMGYFPTEVQAAQAYNRAAMHHYGEFARFNEIEVAA